MTPFAKRLSLALALSVALNLLAGGIWIGRRFRHPMPPQKPFPALHAEREGREGRDGRERREVRKGPLRRLFSEQGAPIEERRKAMLAARQLARAALEAEPFDRAALETSLAKLRSETTVSQEALHHALLDAAAKASMEERRELSRALVEFTGGGGRRERPSGAGPPSPSPSPSAP